MIAAGKIEPLIAVFLDNRDPANLAENRRNPQFFCNRKFIRFVSKNWWGRSMGTTTVRTALPERSSAGSGQSRLSRKALDTASRRLCTPIVWHRF